MERVCNTYKGINHNSPDRPVICSTYEIEYEIQSHSHKAKAKTTLHNLPKGVYVIFGSVR